jgi:uncharacterized protein (DUF1015 family)
MAQIRPFRGILYNQKVIKDLSAVICPPYDVITAQQQDELYKRSPYNFVRVEYNRELPQDTGQDNRYTRAAITLSQWLTQGILQADSQPAIYLHSHHFACDGKQRQRQNVLACVRLEEWDKKIIRPHENIIPRAKSDRLSMLYTCQANTSPILAMYEDAGKIISSLLTIQRKNRPLFDVIDRCGERHQVWAITQPEAIQRIQQEISGQPFYIADGHHRYDSALTYQRERASQSISFTGEEGFNFVMMSLVDFADPGLVILPPHRLVRGISRSLLGSLKSQLQVFFDIEELSLDSPDIWRKVDSRLTGMVPGMKQVRLAIFGLDADNLLILTLRDSRAIEQFMPQFHSEMYKKLDVSLVDHVILEKLLAFDKEKEEITLAYSYDRAEAVNRVRDQQYQLVFILNPVEPELIKNIADIGDRMPRKSTYFFPKSPAGLVFYRW